MRDLGDCIYCGAMATHRDHTTPVSLCAWGRRYDTGETVPSCEECNTLLGSYPHSDINTRKLYLINRYNSRYKKILNQPDWDEEELAELRYNLVTTIRQAMEAKRTIRLKLYKLSQIHEDLE